MDDVKEDRATAPCSADADGPSGWPAVDTPCSMLKCGTSDATTLPGPVTGPRCSTPVAGLYHTDCMPHIYTLPGHPPSTAQDDATLARLSCMLHAFTSQAARLPAANGAGTPSGSAPASTWHGLGHADAARLLLATKPIQASMEPSSSIGSGNLSATQGSINIKWLPRFGCAVVAAGQLPTAAAPGVSNSPSCTRAAGSSGPLISHGYDTRPWHDEVALQLVCVDGWAFSAHSNPGETRFAATAHGFLTKHLGKVPAECYDTFCTTLDELIRAKQAQAAKSKAEGGTSKSFHHSPALVIAMSEPAIKLVRKGVKEFDAEEVVQDLEAQGGYTDVGLHTGTQPRNTAWPLIQAVFKELLKQLCAAAATAPAALVEAYNPFGTSPAEQYHAIASATPQTSSTASASSSACTIPETYRTSALAITSAGSADSPASSPELLFAKAMTHLHLWMLCQLLHGLTPASVTPAVQNACMVVMQAAAYDAGCLMVHGGHALPGYEEGLRGCKERLDYLVSQRAQQEAAGFVLPVLHTGGVAALAEQPGPGYRMPQGTLPAAPQPSPDQGGLEAARVRARNNLGSRPLLTQQDSIPGLLDKLRDGQAWSNALSALEALLQLRGVEDCLFRRAVSGYSTDVLCPPEAVALQEALDKYHGVLQLLLDQHAAAAQACMPQALLSRAVLATWVGYCLMHAAACQEHPCLCNYGVALQYADLSHLKLTDKLAVDALMATATYLQQHYKYGNECFSLRDSGAATFQFAYEFASDDVALPAERNRASADARARMRAHYAEACCKQAEAVRLRRELQQLKEELSNFESQLQELSAEYRQSSCRWSYNTYANKSNDIANKVFDKKSCIQATEGNLRAAESPPAPVIQALPKAEKPALVWLFFLHMPPLLRALSRLAFTAQQMLVPRDGDADVLNVIADTTKYQATVSSHYSTHSQSRTYLASPQVNNVGADGRTLSLCAAGLEQDKWHKASHVDHITSEDVNVWWPDVHGQWQPGMVWHGSDGGADFGMHTAGPFNPFAALPAKTLIDWFTDKLPDAPLQWAMPTYPFSLTAPERDNLALSQPDLRPSRRLSKPSWMQLGRLNSYPLGLHRRLACMLHDNALPWSDPLVQAVVQQCLYRVGEIGLGDAPDGSSGSSSAVEAQRLSFLWRRDWDEAPSSDAMPSVPVPPSVLPALHTALQLRAEELRDKPREHDAVQLLGPAAAYVGNWYPPCQAVAREFAAMTSHAAVQLEAQVAAAEGQPGVQLKLQAQQCKLRMTSLLCYDGNWQLTGEDAGRLMQLLVLIRHGDVSLHGEESSPELELAALRARCHALAVSRVQALTSIGMSAAGGLLLTSAAACVLQQLDRRQAALCWRQLPAAASASSCPTFQMSASFEAEGSDNNLYSINVLDGTVLVDGLPPSRLPKEVLEHPLYKRTFGDVNFEIVRTARGMLKTIKPVAGRFFDFCLSSDHADGQGASTGLGITELEGDVRLELMDVGNNGSCGTWGSELPLRLRELHSHWLCRQHGVIIFRPCSFRLHKVQYVTTLMTEVGCPVASAEGMEAFRAGAAAAAGLHYNLLRVPEHLQHKHWFRELVPQHVHELTDQMVLLTCPLPSTQPAAGIVAANSGSIPSLQAGEKEAG